MTQQIINIGATPNDAQGDPLRVAYNKINQNFTELYTGNGIVTVRQIIAGNPSITLDPLSGTGVVTITSKQILEVDGGQSDSDYTQSLIINGGNA